MAVTLELSSATFELDRVPLRCEDVRVGDRAEVRASLGENGVLVDARVKLEER